MTRFHDVDGRQLGLATHAGQLGVLSSETRWYDHGWNVARSHHTAEETTVRDGLGALSFYSEPSSKPQASTETSASVTAHEQTIFSPSGLLTDLNYGLLFSSSSVHCDCQYPLTNLVCMARLT